MADWTAHAEQTLQTRFVQLTPLGGGDFAQAFRVETADGRTLFAKTHSDPPAGFFSTEANGLDWLSASASVRVPEVLAASDDPPYLVLQWIEPSSGNSSGEAEFGRAMANLHQAPLSMFGREDQRTTGSLALPNTQKTTWPEFYAACRLLPLQSIAAERKVLPQRCLHQMESIASRLDQLGAADEKPSLLHGDLWAGNRMIGEGGESWIIDPAAHGGHREFDLAMMRLFGGFDPMCFDAYQEVSPLQPGWQERIKLHQLAPLVVHAIKFGGHYVSATADALEQYC